MTTAEPIRGNKVGSRVPSDDVYQDLRHRIVQLELRPGERLREQALAADYNISRTPIRRILDRLANDGLVTISPRLGAAVSVVDFDALSEVWAVRMKISELLGDVIRLPAPGMVLEQVEDLIKRIGTAHDGDHLVALFDEYHVILLGLMPEGPVRRIYDQMYAQTARMFAVLIPKLDLALEIEAVETELREFGEALRRADSQRIAEIRLAALRALLDRINSTPLIASSPSP